jgi:hypothetical protein
LVAGKGHETYQDIQGVKHDFDDRVIIREALAYNSDLRIASDLKDKLSYR